MSFTWSPTVTVPMSFMTCLLAEVPPVRSNPSRGTYGHNRRSGVCIHRGARRARCSNAGTRAAATIGRLTIEQSCGGSFRKLDWRGPLSVDKEIATRANRGPQAIIHGPLHIHFDAAFGANEMAIYAGCQGHWLGPKWIRHGLWPVGFYF